MDTLNTFNKSNNERFLEEMESQCMKLDEDEGRFKILSKGSDLLY